MKHHENSRSQFGRRLGHALALAWFCFTATAFAQIDGQTLRGGWYPFDPYQYAVGKNEEKKLTGLDVQLIRAAFARMRREVRLDLVAWDQHQREIEDGRRDLAVGAFRTAEREQYALFSNAYRTERIVLYFRTKDSRAFAFNNDEELIRILESGPYRLGVTEGYFYGERLKRFIDDPRNAGRIVRASSDFDNFNNLLAGKIDAAPVDSLVGATLTWRHGWGDRIAVSGKAFFEEPVHVMFSRKTVPPTLVGQFNQTLADMQRDGEYARIMRDYLLPVLLVQTTSQLWFSFIDIIGTIAFAISGVLLAHKGRYSVLGAVVLASLPSIGGGLMRDALINRDVAAATDFPVYFGIVCATVLVFYIIFHLREWFPRLHNAWLARQQPWLQSLSMRGMIEFCDALGLSTCTVIGVMVALETRVQPLWLWGPILAALTGAGGAILRDVIRSDANNPGLKESFYAEVSLIWGLIFALFLEWYSMQSRYEPMHLSATVAVVVLGALATRIAVVYFRFKSPIY